VHLARNHHESTRKNGLCASHDALDLPVHSAKFCLFSAQRNEQETRACGPAFTHIECREPLQRRFLQTLKGRFPCFAPISYMAPQIPSKSDPNYHFHEVLTDQPIVFFSRPANGQSVVFWRKNTIGSSHTTWGAG
jgi:hypothetical protein